MIQRETAEPVVQYLRALTYDGQLSSDEVWDLANWLNQQPEHIAQNWPAKQLVVALQKAFARSELTETEMEELASTIVAIEELWIEANPPRSEEITLQEITASSSVVGESKPVAPSIPVTAEMPDEGRSDTFTVDLQHHTCNCPEWVENREEFPEGDYRRCCVHLARAFQSLCATQPEMQRDPLFMAFADDHGRRGKGAELDHVWRAVVIKGARVLYGASPASEWIVVFAAEDGAYKRFGYNRRKQRWAYGNRPEDVAWKIASLFSTAQPQLVSLAQ